MLTPHRVCIRVSQKAALYPNVCIIQGECALSRLTSIQEAALDHLTLKHFDEAELSDAEWCKLTGLPQRSISRWKNDPHPRYALFQSVLKQRIRDYECDKDLVARLMRLKALEALHDGMSKATKTDKRGWIKDLLAATKDVGEAGGEVDYTRLTLEQLQEQMLARGLSAEDAIIAEVKEDL
jgi:hypothetical protein